MLWVQGDSLVVWKSAGMKLRGRQVAEGVGEHSSIQSDGGLEGELRSALGIWCIVAPGHALPKAASGLVLVLTCRKLLAHFSALVSTEGATEACSWPDSGASVLDESFPVSPRSTEASVDPTTLSTTSCRWCQPRLDAAPSTLGAVESVEGAVLAPRSAAAGTLSTLWRGTSSPLPESATLRCGCVVTRAVVCGAAPKRLRLSLPSGAEVRGVSERGGAALSGGDSDSETEAERAGGEESDSSPESDAKEQFEALAVRVGEPSLSNRHGFVSTVSTTF